MAPRPEAERSEVAGSTRNGGILKTRLASSYAEMTDETQEINKENTGRFLETKEKKTVSPASGVSATIPPDGGWGWMVLLGTITVNIVMIGHAKTFGVYFKSLMEEFDASPFRVAWLQSLQISIFSFLSPLASVLSQFLGPRKVAFAGGLMAFCGLTVSSFTTSLEVLYIFYGVVQGMALTFTFTPGITMIAKYFDRRRGLANGMTMAGNALGGMLMPFVAHHLMAEYTLRGCFLIMASVMLHSCVGVMLWQPVEWHQIRRKVLNSHPPDKAEDSSESGLDLSLDDRLFDDRRRCVSGPELRFSSDGYTTRERGGSSPQLACHKDSTDSLPLGPFGPSMVRTASSFVYLSSSSFGPASGAALSQEHFGPKVEETRTQKGLGLSEVFEKSRFYIMTASLFFHILGYPGTQMLLPYRATSLDLSRAQAASLLSVLALTDLIGRICCAWLSDLQLCPRKFWFIGGMFASGLIAIVIPWARSYPALLAASAGFGFCCGAYIGLVVVLFADAYGPDKVALAYSVSTVSGGFMALGGPPLMGYVLETTGSYLICQIILGCAQFAGAAAWIAEPWGVRWEKRRQELKSNLKPEEQQLV